MLALFLAGLLAIVGTIVITVVSVICGAWLKSFVVKKLRNRENHKVIFADTREVVDDYIKTKAANSSEISMEDLERMCEDAPYVAAVVDEYGEINEYEGIKSSEYNANFKQRMKQKNGMIILEA